jgi:hypothetical protein
MRIRHLWAVATLCGGIAAFGVAHAQAISVNTWPNDVPCSAISKNQDGSYTLRVPITVGDNTMPAGFIYPNTGEYSVWDQKCGY